MTSNIATALLIAAHRRETKRMRSLMLWWSFVIGWAIGNALYHL